MHIIVSIWNKIQQFFNSANQVQFIPNISFVVGGIYLMEDETFTWDWNWNTQKIALRK